MNITCKSCSVALNLPDDKIPKNIPSLTLTCPKCKQPIVIHLGPSAAAPPPAQDATPPPEEEFDEIGGIAENARLAAVCFDDAAAGDKAKEALEKLEYTVHVPSKPGEAVFWLRRYKFEAVILHQNYGGTEAENPVLKYLQPLAMHYRRHICVGLIGKNIKTLDNMAAFAKSVNFVVAEGDLEKLEEITRKAAADNDKFYAPFKEARREAGKA